MRIFSIAILLLLVGCTGTATRYSNVFDKTAQPVNELQVLYLENKLSSSRNSTSPKEITVLEAIGYNDLSYQIHERVPLVFNLNGLAVEVDTIKRSDFGNREEEKILALARKNDKPIPLLVLQIVSGQTVTNQQGTTMVYLNLHANLISSETKQRIWTGQFQSTLGIGLLGKEVFDNHFVDNMLKQILEQMAKDKMIVLPKGKVVLPEKNLSPQRT